LVLWAITGDLGSGKTILCVELAKQYHNSIPILSNFKIKYPNCNLINPEDLISMKYSKAIIFLDEAYTWLESRMSERKLNIYCDYIIFQSRKRGLDVCITAQLLSTIDVRFRNLYNVLVIAQKTEKRFEYLVIKRSLFGLKMVNWVLPLKKAEDLYGKYDTLEVVNPFGIENMVQDVSVLTNPKKANETINLIVEDAKNEIELITHATVSDFMLQKGYSQSLESFVYARLKQLRQNSKK